MGASSLKVQLLLRNLLNLCVSKSSQFADSRSPIQAKDLILKSIRDLNTIIFMEHKILNDSAGLFLTYDSLTTLDYRSVRQKFLHTCTHTFRLLWNPPYSSSLHSDKVNLIRNVETITVTESVNPTDRLFIHEAGMTRTASVGGSQCRSDA